jgi:hypothetical protein
MKIVPRHGRLAARSGVSKRRLPKVEDGRAGGLAVLRPPPLVSIDEIAIGCS